MRRKKISVLMVIMLMFTITSGIFPGLQEIVYARQFSEDEASITSVSLMINGTQVDENSTLTYPIEQNTEVSLFYTWQIKNSVVVGAGDYIEVDVPQGFYISNNVTGDLSIQEGGSAGTFLLDKASRKLKLTFDSFAESHLDVSGTAECVKSANNVTR